MLNEAGKKKKKEKVEPKEVTPKEYGYDDALDFSEPMGDSNLYKRQGASNIGPWTAKGPEFHDVPLDQRDNLMAVVRGIKKESKSSWDTLTEALFPKLSNVWEAANHWYDTAGLGLGKQTQEGIAAKKEKAAKQKKAK